MAPLIFDGAGTISGLQAGGLPDSSVTSADIANGAITAAKIGYAGAVLQVQSTVKTDAATLTANATITNIPGLTVNITPASSSNKILVMCTINTTGSSTFAGRHLILRRDSTSLMIGDTAGSRNRATISHQGTFYEADGYGPANGGIIFLDSPSSTTQITYGIAYADPSTDSTLYVNRSIDDTDNPGYNRTASSIVVMEIAG